MEQKTKAPLHSFKDKESGKWGFKNSNDEVVVSPRWWLTYHQFSEGMCPVVNDNKKVGFVDENGELVIPCEFAFSFDFREGLCRVQDAETFMNGYINKKGETVIPFLYGNSLGSGRHTVLLFTENGQQVFKNCRGEIISVEQFKTSFTFQEGLVVVIDETDHYGFADENGHLVFSPQWDYADSFEGGFAFVRDGENRFYIDNDGNKLPINHGSSVNMSTGKGLDFLQRMYFKSAYPVKAAIEDEINRLSSQG